MSKTVLFQTIQFSISTLFSSIQPIDMMLPSATTPGKTGPVSDGDEGVHRIPQSSNITKASPSDCLVSYPRYSLGKPYPSAEMQSVYFIARADWATRHSLGGSYPSAEMQSVNSTAPAEWARKKRIERLRFEFYQFHFYDVTERWCVF